MPGELQGDVDLDVKIEHSCYSYQKEQQEWPTDVLRPKCFFFYRFATSSTLNCQKLFTVVLSPK